jgi:hypothetical protein
MSKFQEEHEIETYKSLIQYGATAIRYCFLVNSGAVVAMLAFLGQIWGTEQQRLDPDQIESAIAKFITGIVLAIFASLLAYVTQFRLYREGNSPELPARHMVFVWLAIVLAFLSVLMFLWGSWSSADLLARGASWQPPGWNP